MVHSQLIIVLCIPKVRWSVLVFENTISPQGYTCALFILRLFGLQQTNPNLALITCYFKLILFEVYAFVHYLYIMPFCRIASDSVELTYGNIVGAVSIETRLWV